MKLKTTLFAALLLATATTICSAATADDYVGTWVNVSVPKNTVVIEHKGDAYVFRETNYDVMTRELHTSPPKPAKLVNGALQVVTIAGPLPFTLTNTGHLTGADMEFVRVQGAQR
jgi:hypothetical protein